MLAWRTVMVLGVVAGCGVEPARPPFAWPVGTHPTGIFADGSTDPQWTEMVEAARAEWSGPLVAMGCVDPFEGPAGSPVILVPDSAWTMPDKIGETTADQIVVKGTMRQVLANGSYTSVLPHELGHALGLEHVGPLRDADSIMHTPSDRTQPSQMDLDRAAETIGCR